MNSPSRWRAEESLQRPSSSPRGAMRNAKSRIRVCVSRLPKPLTSEGRVSGSVRGESCLVTHAQWICSNRFMVVGWHAQIPMSI